MLEVFRRIPEEVKKQRAEIVKLLGDVNHGGYIARVCPQRSDLEEINFDSINLPKVLLSRHIKVHSPLRGLADLLNLDGNKPLNIRVHLTTDGGRTVDEIQLKQEDSWKLKLYFDPKTFELYDARLAVTSGEYPFSKPRDRSSKTFLNNSELLLDFLNAVDEELVVGRQNWGNLVRKEAQVYSSELDEKIGVPSDVSRTVGRFITCMSHAFSDKAFLVFGSPVENENNGDFKIVPLFTTLPVTEKVAEALCAEFREPPVLTRGEYSRGFERESAGVYTLWNKNFKFKVILQTMVSVPHPWTNAAERDFAEFLVDQREHNFGLPDVTLLWKQPEPSPITNLTDIGLI
ncbi:hypothetical protein A2Z23_02135 [Candidatus Curtissbacteria bacterium RBG_16_39_7]|uniref:Uncharacterized protein n=1 Tax=Candidatus Curtissbacteria bacterium RBG_16_39_7 TaxID=1797707 RepID=A0A1F5G1Y6_9BACT|nr:MAG: hypothetical protein A2Z23_02135 [Candidatus Curtissbacteria bacterium RBG_16_39_7]